MTRTVLQRLTVMLCALVMSLAAKAQVAQYLVVTQNDGVTVTFALASQPVVTFDNGNLTVTSDNQTFEAAMADVASYSFADTYTSIDEVQGDTNPMLTNGNARLENMTPGSVVNIFTIDGRRAGTATATTDGTVNIDLNNLGAGVFILSTGKASYKIYNR